MSERSTKPLTSRDVQGALFDFLQHTFSGEPPPKRDSDGLFAIDADAENWLFARLEDGAPLTAAEISRWPVTIKGTARELLTQYCIFTGQFQSLPFPPDFLEGCAGVQLGTAVQAYVAAHRWPFPQQLQRPPHPASR